MKKLSFILILAILSVLAVSCKKESAGKTQITYYADIKLQGANPYKMVKGTDWVDPGFTATMNGEDVTDDVVVDDSDVDTENFGMYKVTYSLVNADGYVFPFVRDVYVLGAGVANIYNSFCKYGTRQFNIPFVVNETSTPDVYSIDDLFGGFYSRGRYPGYPYDFDCEATIRVNPDNSLSIAECPDDWYFGGSFDLSSFAGTYNPATGVLSWTIEGDFLVTLTPESLD